MTTVCFKNVVQAILSDFWYEKENLMKTKKIKNS